MKNLMKYVLAALFVLTGVTSQAFAQVQEEEELQFKDQAIRLLVEKAEIIQIYNGEERIGNFVRIKDNLINFLSNSFPFFGDDDEDELPTDIERFDYGCKKEKFCYLKLMLKNNQKVKYSFVVEKDGEGKASSILNNRVEMQSQP